ncbi:MAG: rhodanese-like domain-containing protein [Balneolaceae bacterium]
MFQFIKNIISTEEPVDLAEFHRNGAKIIDVRTSGEYKSGHIKGSLNIPLQSLSNSLNKLNPTEPFIVCCASGARSSSAKRLLKTNGFENVENGGGWQYLKSILD